MPTSPSPVQPEYVVEPTAADLRYGPHERNVLDYWGPRSGKPAPLVMYTHGGGFRAGDKTKVSQDLLQRCLDAGFAFASINYRLSHQASAPAFQLDGARALQFLRANAAKLKFDPSRVGLGGGSAGAGISLWIGFHDDLADPSSDDPVARQSTRVNCIAIRNGQCSYSPVLFRQLGLDAAIQHKFIEPFYGMKREQFDTPEALAAFDEAAAVTYVKRGAPPVLAYHTASLDPVPKAPEPNDPDPEATMTRLASWAVHHPLLSVHLKQKLEEVGAECEVVTELKGVEEGNEAALAFFIRHLKP